LFSYGVDLDRRVRAEHLLRRVRAMIDFTFARAAVAHTYGENGNISVDPVVRLKLMFFALPRERPQRMRAGAPPPSASPWRSPSISPFATGKVSAAFRHRCRVASPHLGGMGSEIALDRHLAGWRSRWRGQLSGPIHRLRLTPRAAVVRVVPVDSRRDAFRPSVAVPNLSGIGSPFSRCLVGRRPDSIRLRRMILNAFTHEIPVFPMAERSTEMIMSI
jgi:hypothetical protein